MELLVSLGVEGGAKFSHGNLGVDAEASKNLKFVISNHKCIPLGTPVKDALREALEKFEFPFKPEGVEALDDNDYLDYEFIGSCRWFSASITALAASSWAAAATAR